MKKVIVVGAGIAGLTVAIYARRSGFDVTLIEQHSIVGGMCTSWKRKGYLFEGAIHWLTGSSPNTTIHQLWKDTGALDETVPILMHDPFFSLEWEGQILHLYRDINKTVNELLKLSPQDEPLLRRFAKDVVKAGALQMPITDIKDVKSAKPSKMSLSFLFKMLPVLPVMKKYGKISIDEFGTQFKHPAFGRLLRGVVPETYDASSLLFTLATLHAGDGGYPEGGSLPMVHRMAKTFTDLGGVLLLNTSVIKVNIHNGKTTGVTLENGALDADAVIVTQETIAAVAKLFDTPPNDAWISELIRETESEVCTFISIGVRTELPDGALPVWELNTPITHAENTIHSIGFNSYRRYAPQGGTALTTIFGSDTYDFWKKAKSEGRYEEEKQAIAGQVSRALCEKYPQCEGKIEVIDIATPMTYERYTGAYHGSWMSIKRPGSKMKIYPGECENINGLYFAGHRIMPPGGLPGALATGRTAAQQLCRQFNVMFVSDNE